MVYIGTAGWAIPKKYAHLFPTQGTHLERYARKFLVTEINQTFYRLPKPTTLEKWKHSTPENFRFITKLPRAITHFSKLKNLQLLDAFLSYIHHLDPKLLAILVQLPPSLAFDEKIAEKFFGHLRKSYQGIVAVEPRHVSWSQAEDLFKKFHIAKVAADPPRFPEADRPSGWEEVCYFRLHGHPKIYYSEYDRQFLENIAKFLKTHPAKTKIVIFDNTASGAAIKNALELEEMV